MTASELIATGRRLLDAQCIEDSAFDCDCIFQSVFGVSRYSAVLDPDFSASANKQRLFFDRIERRCKREPLQYILGEWDFYDLTFYVGDGVLIPRPETEFLVDFLSEYLRRQTSRRTIFDLCCGSGCIGLTLAKRFPQHHFLLLDISQNALQYAHRNQSRYHLKNVQILQYDITQGFRQDFFLLQPDVIVSNPPYIPHDEIDTLQKEVAAEPSIALDGGADGLDFYRVIADKWIPHLMSGGMIAVESGENQPSYIAEHLLKDLTDVQIHADCFGTERFVTGKKGS